MILQIWWSTRALRPHSKTLVAICSGDWQTTVGQTNFQTFRQSLGGAILISDRNKTEKGCLGPSAPSSPR